MPANKAGPWIPSSQLKGPSVVKELVTGAIVGLCAGGIWKVQQWKWQKQYKTFYDMLEKDQISVVVENE